MHYLERLLRRARAEPRESNAGVFDPFEQVAPWDEVPTEQAAAARAVEPPAPMEAGRVMPSASPVTSDATAVSPSPLPDMHESRVSAVPPIDPPRLEPEVPVRPIDARRAPLRATTEDAAPTLARADAFMRALGVPLSPADRAPVPPPAHDPVVASPVRATHAPPPEGAPSPVAARPPLLQPPSPSPVPLRPAPSPGPPRATAALPAAAPPPAASRRAAITPVPERIVQTTVVLAPPSRRLDDLAHSSAISRFGIGQS